MTGSKIFAVRVRTYRHSDPAIDPNDVRPRLVCVSGVETGEAAENAVSSWLVSASDDERRLTNGRYLGLSPIWDSARLSDRVPPGSAVITA